MFRSKRPQMLVGAQHTEAGGRKHGVKLWLMYG